MASTASLFQTAQLGNTTIENRMIMAPLTRCRATNYVPNSLMAEYYSQRASAGLIITECTAIAPGAVTFGGEPGIYNEDQVNAWRQVVDAVHAKGGKIFIQIWHAGRAAHPNFNQGRVPVSSSAIAIEGDEVHTPQGKASHVTPKALDKADIQDMVNNYRQAAAHAMQAGFDGVEVHAANGYLIDQFLRDSANQRSDDYGGSLENRMRFLLEVLTAVCEEIGAERVGVRLSPLNSYNGMADSDPLAWSKGIATALNTFNLAYLHLMRADFFGKQEADVVPPVRECYQGHLMVNMGYSAEEAAACIDAKQADSVAFGTGFLANPDLPARVRANAPLNTPDQDTFYTPGARGYTDYPTMDKA